MKNLLVSKPKNLIKCGDIVQLGRHRLACGDSRNADLVHKLLNTRIVKLILADPPYGVGLVEGKKGFNGGTKHKVIVNDHIQCKEDYQQFTKDYLEVIKPYLATKNALYLFNSEKMLCPMLHALEDSGYHSAQLLIWVKNQAVINRMDYLVQHELIVYGWFGRHEFIKSKDKSVLFFPKPLKNIHHPTMKPLRLLRSLILNSTRIDDLIFDPFLGSGSTLLAAEQTRRCCFGIEIDPYYCQIIMDRFEKLTGIRPKFIS